MSKYKRLGKNSIFILIGNIGSKTITFFMLPFYTAWLSTSEYGTIDVLAVYMSIISSLVVMGISDAIFIFPKGQSDFDKSKYFSSGLFFSFCSFSVLLLLFFYFQYSEYNLKAFDLIKEYNWLIFGSLFCSFLQSYLQQFARGIDLVNVYSISGGVLTFSTALFSFFLVKNYSIYGYLSSSILASLVSIIYLFISTKAYKYFSYNFISIGKIKEMLKYSIPLIPNLIMWWFIGGMNRPIMEKYLGLGAIGLYAVAYKFPSLISIVFSIFVNSWQISVTEEFNKKTYSDFYNTVFRVLFIILVLISFFLTIFSKEILYFFVDKKFIDGWRYIPILCLSFIFSSISSFVGSNFLANRKTKYFFYSSVWGAIISIALNFILIPSLGMWGVCLSVVFSHLVMAFSRAIYSWKFVKIKNIPVYLILILLDVSLIIGITSLDNSFIVRIVIFTLVVTFLFLLNKSFLLKIFEKMSLQYLLKSK